MFRNLGKGKYEHVSPSLGAAFNVAQVARGAAYADYDHDGDLDILVANNHGPARLLRNDGGSQNRWLCVKAVGRRSNRSGIGAIVRIQSAGGRQWTTVRSGGSYASQSDLAVTFGLGQDASVSALEVEWPSGTKDRLTNVAANQFLTIEEGKGLVPSPATRSATASARATAPRERGTRN